MWWLTVLLTKGRGCCGRPLFPFRFGVHSPLLCLSHPPLSSLFFLKQEAPVLPLQGVRKPKEPGAVHAVGGHSCLACEEWFGVNSLKIFWTLYPSQEFDPLYLISAFLKLIYKAFTGKKNDEFAFSKPNHNSGFDVP